MKSGMNKIQIIRVLKNQ